MVAAGQRFAWSVLMPIYEYACKQCGHELDALQKMSDEPLRECPACGEPALKRKISAPRFRLKGSGWYETDFKQDNRRNLADGGDGKPASDGGDKAPAADKPADKPAAKPDAGGSAASSASKGSDGGKAA
jgi:putative FmdB family regulatory protein